MYRGTGNNEDEVVFGGGGINTEGEKEDDIYDSLSNPVNLLNDIR